MISQGDFERKDFSVAMDELVVKLSATYNALIQAEDHGYAYSDKDLVGFGCIIRDIHDDLNQIYKALYGD